MPKFTTETARVERKFSGIDFTVPYVFAEAHPLTKPEAAWLNSNLASVVGNAFSGDIRRGLVALNKAGLEAHVKAGGKPKDYKEVTDPKALKWNFQSEFDTKFAEYELGESNRGTGGGAASPVDQLVRMFSTVDVKARLAKKGLKVAPLYKAPSNMKDDKGEALYPSKWEELVSENIKSSDAGTHPTGANFRKQAEEQLANLAGGEAVEGEDDALLAGITQEATPAAAAA